MVPGKWVEKRVSVEGEEEDNKRASEPRKNEFFWTFEYIYIRGDSFFFFVFWVCDSDDKGGCNFVWCGVR